MKRDQLKHTTMLDFNPASHYRELAGKKAGTLPEIMNALLERAGLFI
jgi:hypothetical protein